MACVLHTHTRAGMAVAAMQCGLLPLSQTAMRFVGHIGLHDYEGPAIDLGERERIVRDLGPHDALIMRNHGLLTCGATIQQAFNTMYQLELSCRTQVDAMAARTDWQCRAQTAKAVLESNAFRWSSPSLFNDPFDMQFDLHLEYDRERVVNRVLDQFMDVYTGRAQPVTGRALDEKAKLLRACMPGIKEGEVRKEHRAAIYEALRLTVDALPKLHEELRAILAPRKLLCLSEIPDSLIMWAHYAENHAGAVIEVSYIEEGTYASTWGAAKPVRYNANMPRLADGEALTRCLLGEGPLATPQQFQDLCM